MGLQPKQAALKKKVEFRELLAPTYLYCIVDPLLSFSLCVFVIAPLVLSCFPGDSTLVTIQFAVVVASPWPHIFLWTVPGLCRKCVEIVGCYAS